MGSVSTSEAGDYSILFRSSTDGGKTWTYCDTSDNNSYNAEDAIHWHVGDNSGHQEDDSGIGWCVIQYPQYGEITEGESLDVYGRVWVNGCTDGGRQCKKLISQVGYGVGDNIENFNWSDASFNKFPPDIGNNNEFVGKIVPEAPGNYRYGYRFSIDNGKTWRYCDTEGASGFDQNKLGYLTVNELVYNYEMAYSQCSLYVPWGSIEAGDTQYVRLIFHIKDCTHILDPCPGIHLEFAYGTGNDPNTYNYIEVEWSESKAKSSKWILESSLDGTGIDCYTAMIQFDKPGTYRIFSRMTWNGGKSWYYCPGSPSAAGYELDLNDAGTVSVE